MRIYGTILAPQKTQNVYIWHRFDPPKNKFVFSPATGCIKNVYIWDHFDKEKTNCFFRLRRTV
jgi:hypothetical protein